MQKLLLILSSLTTCLIIFNLLGQIMPRKCVVPNCPTGWKGPSHTFPAEENARNVWLDAIERPDLKGN